MVMSADAAAWSTTGAEFGVYPVKHRELGLKLGFDAKSPDVDCAGCVARVRLILDAVKENNRAKVDSRPRGRRDRLTRMGP